MTMLTACSACGTFHAHRIPACDLLANLNYYHDLEDTGSWRDDLLPEGVCSRCEGAGFTVGQAFCTPDDQSVPACPICAGSGRKAA